MQVTIDKRDTHYLSAIHGCPLTQLRDSGTDPADRNLSPPPEFNQVTMRLLVNLLKICAIVVAILALGFLIGSLA
jgi:hypothetical protein